MLLSSFLGVLVAAASAARDFVARVLDRALTALAICRFSSLESTAPSVAPSQCRAPAIVRYARGKSRNNPSASRSAHASRVMIAQRPRGTYSAPGGRGLSVGLITPTGGSGQQRAFRRAVRPPLHRARAFRR